MFFQINIGCVQAYIVDKDKSENYHHFGSAVYDRNKPILSDANREKAQDVCNRLNDNEMTFKDAQKELDKL